MAARPVATPELYDGTTSFDEWTDHFESVAKLNGWKDDDMEKWLAVRLVGRANTAYKRLSEGIRAGYRNSKTALRRRFEPESKQSLYASEFQVRCKYSAEDSLGHIQGRVKDSDRQSVSGSQRSTAII